MSEDHSKPIVESEDLFGGPVFEPRLYVQRYSYVKQELAKHNVKSIVDFGSAECKISRFLVQIPTAQRIALVDLDNKLLEQHKYSVRPFTTDYLNRKDVQTDVDIYHGSATDLDRHIVGFEAVSMVEIIEHLVPDVLSGTVAMVFGQLQPRVIVVTTPNSDYNVLFPNFSGFRHWDHKFEWSQEEFKEWCDRVAGCHGYSVEYGGVGLPPVGREHLGLCSQAATFIRQGSYRQPCSSSVKDCYELIAHTCYPCKEKSSLSEDEQFLMEIKFIMRQYCNNQRHETIVCNCETETPNQSIQTGDYSIETRNKSTKIGNHSIEALCPDCLQARYQVEEDVYLVPPSYLMKYKKVQEKMDTDSLKIYLKNNGYRLTEDALFIIIPEDGRDSDSDTDDHDNVDVCSNSAVCIDENIVTVKSYEVESWD